MDIGILVVEDDKRMQDELVNFLNKFPFSSVPSSRRVRGVDNLASAKMELIKPIFYNLSIDGSFYVDEKRILQGKHCNSLAKEARALENTSKSPRRRAIVGLSYDPSQFDKNLFDAVFDKSAIIKEIAELNSKYSNPGQKSIFQAFREEEVSPLLKSYINLLVKDRNS